MMDRDDFLPLVRRERESGYFEFLREERKTAAAVATVILRFLSIFNSFCFFFIFKNSNHRNLTEKLRRPSTGTRLDHPHPHLTGVAVYAPSTCLSGFSSSRSFLYGLLIGFYRLV